MKRPLYNLDTLGTGQERGSNVPKNDTNQGTKFDWFGVNSTILLGCRKGIFEANNVVCQEIRKP